MGYQVVDRKKLIIVTRIRPREQVYIGLSIS
jgi:hypothetical protein